MAKPKLALIPAAQGTKFYSVLPSDGVGDFDFTRGSKATRINAQGLIEIVNDNISRLNYPLIDGVQKGCPHHILEPARTNSIQYSESFSQWTNDRVTVSENQIISPNGTLNADLISENSENNIHRIYIGSITLTDNVDYTITVFAKKGNSKVIQLTPTSTSAIGSGRANFDLENGVLGDVSGGTAEIKDYGNGWYRCSYSFEALATVTSAIAVNLVNDDLNAVRNVTYLGNINNNVYLWGAMLEEGSYSTSYIPNNGNAAGVTRSAETASGAGNSTTFNSSEGVLMAEISGLVESSPARVISIGEGLNYENGLIMSFDTSDNLIKYRVRSNNVTTVDLSASNIDRTSNHKICLKYKANDFALWIDGFKINYVLSGAVPLSLSKLQFSDMNVTGAPFYGNTKQLQYFDSALADTQLEQLTSWQSFRDMANGQLYTIE